MSWPTEDDAQLTVLWAKGVSAAEIGRIMGRTKNSIVGRAHRLKLPGRKSPIRRVANVPAPSARPVFTLPPFPEHIPSVERELCPVFVATSPRRIATKPLPISIVPLQQTPIRRERRCEYLSGNTKPYVQCAADADNGSYCRTHTELCHVKRRERVE